MSTLFDQAQRICRGDSLPPPVARLIGFTLTSIAPRHARIAFEAGAQHANPMGTLHGGILCDIADAAMGMAYASTLGAGETFTTLELKINFLKPVWQAKLQAIGRYLGYYVSIFGLMIGFAWVAFDPRKQGWHDKLARTLVIRG